MLGALYKLGLRTVQFATQTGFNAFADSAAAPLQGGQAPVFYGGLNDNGRKLVAKMNDLGIPSTSRTARRRWRRRSRRVARRSSPATR